MTFSFTAFLVTQICVCILISIWCFILNKKWALKKLYLNFWLFITPVIIIRLFLPFEFPYTVTIPSEKILPPIARFFFRPITEDETRTVGDLFICIWILGTVIALLYNYRKNQKIYHLVNTLIYGEKQEDYQSILHDLGYEKFLQNNPIRIFKTQYVTTPLVVGDRRPIILLPEISFTEKEMYYILAHEMTHLYKKDARTLAMMSILQCVFWWNPFIHLFRREISKLLELRVDGILIENYDKRQIAEYVECILKVYKYQVSFDRQADMNNRQQVLAFTRKGDSALLKRINYLLSKHSYVYSYIVAILFVVIAIFSTGFVFESCSIDSEDAKGTFSIEEDADNYFIQKDDRSYDVYIDGNMVGNILELPRDEAFKKFKVYQNFKEVE